MAKFRFKVKEVNRGIIEIEANSLKDAKKQVFDTYYNGHTEWGIIDTDNDVKITRLNQNKGD